MNVQESIVTSALKLANDIGADAILTLTETGETYKLLREKAGDIEVIALTPNEDTYNELKKEDFKVINMSVRDPTRMGQIRHAVWRGLNSHLLSPGDLVVCLTGDIGSPKGADTISVYLISKQESTLAGVIESDPVMNAIVELATELGYEGREGEPIGTAFIIGDTDSVIEKTRQLGLNPFKGYDDLNITDEKNWELIKRYSFLDGAFLLDSDGNVLAAGKYLDADADVEIPSGLGTRHLAVAKMTKATDAMGVTVSGTDGVIRVFEDGDILGRIDPRSRMLKEVSI